MMSGRLPRTCSWQSSGQSGAKGFGQCKETTVPERSSNARAYQDLDLRQACRLMALTTMQKTFAGMNPNCAVRNPITQMMMLLTPANAQPSQ